MITNTSAATMQASPDLFTYASANTCEVMTAHCALNRTMHVDIRLADAISRTVTNRKTAEEAKVFAAANSTKPMRYLMRAVNTTARTAKAQARPRKSGTRYIRNLATPLSRIEMRIASANTFSR